MPNTETLFPEAPPETELLEELDKIGKAAKRHQATGKKLLERIANGNGHSEAAEEEVEEEDEET